MVRGWVLFLSHSFGVTDVHHLLPRGFASMLRCRESLERLLPSDWDHHSPEELMNLDLAGLAKFPLSEFLDDYKLQIKTYVEVRLEDAELRINTEEENLKAKAITAEGLRQTLADLRTLERMPQVRSPIYFLFAGRPTNRLSIGRALAPL